MTKEQRAVELRDLVLPVVVRRGSWESMADACVTKINVLSYRDKGFTIVYRMPFESIPEAVPDEIEPPPAANDKLPYALDIWYGKKVLDIEWADDGRIALRDYKPGRWWERRLWRISGEKK